MRDFEQQTLIQRQQCTTSLTCNNGVDWQLIRIQAWMGGDEIEIIQRPKRPKRFEETK